MCYVGPCLAHGMLHLGKQYGHAMGPTLGNGFHHYHYWILCRSSSTGTMSDLLGPDGRGGHPAPFLPLVLPAGTKPLLP